MKKHKEHRRMCLGRCNNPKFKVKVWNYNPNRHGIGNGKSPDSLDSCFIDAWEAVDHVALIIKMNPRWERIQLTNEKGEILKEWRNKNIGTLDQSLASPPNTE